MLESEIREQLITQAKNIKYLNSVISEIEKLPEAEADERAEEYYFCLDKLVNTNCLDDTITRRRLINEMQDSKELFPDEPNLYRELIPVAIRELKENNHIYWIDNKYVCKEGSSNKKILEYLVNSFFRNQNRFGLYLERIQFKEWACEVFKKMNYAASEESIKKEIDTILRG